MGNNNQYPPCPSLIREGVVHESMQYRKNLCKIHVSTGTITFPSYLWESEHTTAGDGDTGDQSDIREVLKQVQHEGNTFSERTYFTYSLHKKAAFTLAEVLITLGIIGVVAATTIPVLLANHRKTVAETRLAKFYSTMNQAVQRAEADYGDKTQWDKYEKLYEQDENGNNDTSRPITNVEYFNKYFAPYIIATKIVTDDGTGKAIVYFPDGSLASFSASSIVFYPNAKDYSITENQVSGGVRGSYEHRGTKSFTFIFAPTENSTDTKYSYAKGVEPYKWRWDGTEDMLRNDNEFGCKKEVSNERAYCTALIQMNGWKIPKDYPLRF